MPRAELLADDDDPAGPTLELAHQVMRAGRLEPLTVAFQAGRLTAEDAMEALVLVNELDPELLPGMVVELLLFGGPQVRSLP